MPKRDLSYRRLRKIYVGDMRERISLEERSILAPSYNSPAASEGYAQIVETWARVETEFNNRVFDEVALDAKPSIKFTIRYRPNITTETRVRYNDILYKVAHSDNLEERNEYLILYAAIEGADDREVNQ